MSDRRHLLKLKLKSLAAEAKIIRAAERKLQEPLLRFDKQPAVSMDGLNEEERKQFAQSMRLGRRQRRAAIRAKPWFNENRAALEAMHNHRVLDIRETARATHLAYGFIRGKTYRQLEGNRQTTYCNDRFLSAGEARVWMEAENMVRYYGPGLSHAEASRLLADWTENRTSALSVSVSGPSQRPAWELIPSRPDSGGTALAAPSKQ